MSDSRVVVFTSAARNYLPKVRVLFDSLQRHHPEWHRHLLLVERDARELDRESANAHTVQSLPDLQIPHWEPWSFCHRLVELATAVKPFGLKQLLTSGDFDFAIYLDPDVAVFSRLDDLVDGFEQSSILLCPHQLTPEVTLGRVMDNEITSLRHGVYNLGFLGVACDEVGIAFAEWWSQRLYFFCRDDLPRGLFTDQKWADLIPALFPAVGIVRSSRHNVASWNLSERELVQDGDSYWVDGSHLGFYHFTSVSNDSHELMAAKNSDNPAALVGLLRWYREQEEEAQVDSGAQWSFANYSDGTPIPDEHRLSFRDTRGLQAKYANPYDAAGLKRQLESESCAAAEAVPETPLSTGYALHEALFDQAKVRRLLKSALLDPSSLGKISRKAINILGREGLAGVLRRLR